MKENEEEEALIPENNFGVEEVHEKSDLLFRGHHKGFDIAVKFDPEQRVFLCWCNDPNDVSIVSGTPKNGLIQGIGHCLAMIELSIDYFHSKKSK